jgi:transcriptional regulator with XRE-family HTH domain
MLGEALFPFLAFSKNNKRRDSPVNSPIKLERQKLEITVRELAILAGTTEQTVRANERGDNVEVTEKILTFLEKQGANRTVLEKQYKSFRTWKQKELLQRLKV